MSWGFIFMQGEHKLTRKDTVLAAVWRMGWEGWAGEKSGTGIHDVQQSSERVGSDPTLVDGWW